MDPVNRLNHTSRVSVFTPADRPKSGLNHCVIEDFGGVFLLSFCFLDFSVGVGAFFSIIHFKLSIMHVKLSIMTVDCRKVPSAFILCCRWHLSAVNGRNFVNYTLQTVDYT